MRLWNFIKNFFTKKENAINTHNNGDWITNSDNIWKFGKFNMKQTYKKLHIKSRKYNKTVQPSSNFTCGGFCRMWYFGFIWTWLLLAAPSPSSSTSTSVIPVNRGQ